MSRGVTLLLCLMPATALAGNLVKFTGPDNQVIQINPQQVVGIRTPREGGEHFHPKAKCLIFTTDGKFSSVIEDCAEVQWRLEEESGK